MNTRVCTACKQEKELTLFALKKTSADGKSAQCRVCVNAQKADYNKRAKEKVAAIREHNKLNPTQMKSCGLGGWTGPRVRDEHEAPGVLVDYMSSVFVPESAYYRNDGLSHIKTRGTLC